MRLNRKKEDHYLDSVIERLTAYLETCEPGTDEYRAIANELERMAKIKSTDEPPADRVSRNTLAIIAGNLVGILLIVAYEQHHVWTSKATSTLMRPKHPEIT